MLQLLLNRSEIAWMAHIDTTSEAGQIEAAATRYLIRLRDDGFDIPHGLAGLRRDIAKVCSGVSDDACRSRNAI